MSWKSLVCAGLLCALVTPVFAAPALVTPANPTIGTSDENWHWILRVDPNGTGSISTELALSAQHSNLITVVEPNPYAATWDREVPANAPASGFGFWTEFTDFGIEASGNNAMIALGSGALTDTPTNLVEVVTQEPFYVNSGSHRLTTRINVFGAYTGDTQGNLSQGGVDTLVSGQWQYYVRPGDANLDGSVGFADNNIWLSNTGTNLRWTGADYNDDNSIGFADKAIWLAAPNPGAPPLGGGAGSGSAIPEPSSLVLAGIVALALAGFRRSV